ncbi:MAG: hypothetical protein Q9184_003608 [Pyrenodesmia sp. 2 TL-2023]
MSSWSRQQPGSACEECRKRKLRCDRQKPQCGTCLDADIICIFNTKRLRRGPKQGGGLKALRSRIGMLYTRSASVSFKVPVAAADVHFPAVTLEGLLRNRQEDGHSAVDDHEQTENTPSDGSGSDDEPSRSPANKSGPFDKRSSTPQPHGPSTDAVICNMHSMPKGMEISELMRADL